MTFCAITPQFLVVKKQTRTERGNGRSANINIAKYQQYKLCLLVHKSLLRHTPEYTSDLLTSVR